MLRSATRFRLASASYRSFATSTKLSTSSNHNNNTDAILLDGIATSQTRLDSIRTQLDALRSTTNSPSVVSSSSHPSSAPRRPHLFVLLTNASRDSLRYVERKSDVAKQIGFLSTTHRFDESTVTLTEVIELIQRMNQQNECDGILVQLPLAPQLAQHESLILSAVDPLKDVDGFHPLNIANLCALASREGGADEKAAETGNNAQDILQLHQQRQHEHQLHHVPCTPKACLELLDSYNIPLRGSRVVILGRSAGVGLPLTLLLMSRRATVTNIDASTPSEIARQICQQADLLIVAVGKPEYIRSDWIKPNSTIIDIGINFIPKSSSTPLSARHVELENPSDARDQMKLVGDVAFEECATKAKYIAPVPGGVGPMTVAMLMENTWRSYVWRTQKRKE